MAIFISYWKSDKKITLLLASVHDGVPRLAWSAVVYSVLNPVKITIHMIVALLIVALLIYLIKRLVVNNDNFKRILFKQVVLLI
jgi:cytochrome c oxidase assembly protein subunit 15